MFLRFRTKRSFYGLNSFIALCMVSTLFLFVGSAIAAPAENADTVVAMVNDRPITEEQFFSALERVAGTSVLNQLIAEALIAEEAEARGLVVTEAEVQNRYDIVAANYGGEAMLAQVMQENNLTLERLLFEIRLTLIVEALASEGVEVSKEEMLAFFEANKESLAEPAQTRVSHILVETEESAQALLEQLNKGADFAALAKEHSKDPGSAAQGGDIGYISPQDQLVPEFRSAMEQMSVGETSKPVKSAYGYHIIRVTEKTLPRPANFADYEEVIYDQVLMEKSRSFDEIVQDLFGKFSVSVQRSPYQVMGNTN